MKAVSFVKKCATLLLVVFAFFILTGCGENAEKSGTHAGKPYKCTDEGILISPTGEEYQVYGSEEAGVHWLGELEYDSRVKGEVLPLGPKVLWHGVYTVKGNETKDILVRYFPHNEWGIIYRKTSLPPVELTIENADRLELLQYSEEKKERDHISCGKGITDPKEMEEFFEQIQTQPLTEVTAWDGVYGYGYIYCFYEEETNVALKIKVLSYNDQEYSVWFNGGEYILSPQWMARLQG